MVYFMRAIIGLILSLWIGHAALASEFVTHELPDGVRIQTPGHWKVLSKDMRKNIRAATEAIAEQADASLRKATNVLHVNATPEPTGAIVRVTIGPAPTFSADDLKDLKSSDLVDLQDTFTRQMRAVQNSGGPELIESYLPRIEPISGIPSITWSYRRRSVTGQGTWYVTQYKIPAPSMLVEVTISYRESDAGLWKPILAKVRQSLNVPR